MITFFSLYYRSNKADDLLKLFLDSDKTTLPEYTRMFIFLFVLN